MKCAVLTPLFLGLALAGSANEPTNASDEEARRVELVDRVERSVVVVLVEGLRIAHGDNGPSLRPSESLGTGIVVTPDGLILTAAHVVAEAGRVRVKLVNNEPLTAHVAFSDGPSDIALLRLDEPPAALVIAELGDSDRVRKGETVYVIGNPAGIERSLSVGVVSGRHSSRHVFGGAVEAELIQTDAAINPGNSGGPIFNSEGRVIAIAQGILTKGGGSEGLGFGLAINDVKKIVGLDPCIWMGLTGARLDGGWADALNVPEPGGLLVERVVPGGPADLAGIRGGEIPVQAGQDHFLLGGDVILRADGMPILEWIRRGRRPPPAPAEIHDIRLTLLRAGIWKEVTVRVAHRAARWN